jgi:hypothetical protein
MSDSVFRDYAKDFEELGLAPLYQKTFEELTLEEKRRVLCFELQKNNEFIKLPKMIFEKAVPKWVDFFNKGSVRWLLFPLVIIMLANFILPDFIYRVPVRSWLFLAILCAFFDKFIKATFIRYILKKHNFPLVYPWYGRISFTYRLMTCFDGILSVIIKLELIDAIIRPTIGFLIIFLAIKSTLY